MKHYLSGMVIALSLALVLVLGVVALAENAPQAPELPAANALQTPEETPDNAQTPDDAQASDDTALQAALKALQEARQSDHEQDLKEELDGYVAAGKLTQAQADLIMNHYKEQQALRNGTCPSCGYQFQNGKGGRMNGNGHGVKGGFGGRGGRMNSGFGGQMNGGFGGGMMPGQADGMSAQPDEQAMPRMDGDEGV